MHLPDEWRICNICGYLEIFGLGVYIWIFLVYIHFSSAKLIFKYQSNELSATKIDNRCPSQAHIKLKTRSSVGPPKNPLTCLLYATWHTSLSLGPRLIRKAERQGKRGAPHQQGRQTNLRWPIGCAIMWQKSVSRCSSRNFFKAARQFCS